MTEMQPQFANLANFAELDLRNQLKATEPQDGQETDDRGLHQAREVVIAAIGNCCRSRYNLGRALSTYRDHIKEEHCWMAAVKVIAAALDCGERTVHRVLEQYRDAAKLPPAYIESMEEQGIDPAAGKNVELTAELLQMPEPQSREEAGKVVAEAQRKAVAKKEARKLSATKPAEASLDEFAARIVKHFQARYREATHEQRRSEFEFVFDQLLKTLGIEAGELHREAKATTAVEPERKKAA